MYNVIGRPGVAGADLYLIESNSQTDFATTKPNWPSGPIRRKIFLHTVDNKSLGVCSYKGLSSKGFLYDRSGLGATIFEANDLVNAIER